LVKHYEHRSIQGEEANLDEVEDISEETVVDLEKESNRGGADDSLDLDDAVSMSESETRVKLKFGRGLSLDLIKNLSKAQKGGGKERQLKQELQKATKMSFDYAAYFRGEIDQVPGYDKAMDYILLGHKTTEERISLVLKSTEYYELSGSECLTEDIQERFIACNDRLTKVSHAFYQIKKRVEFSSHHMNIWTK
jgi:hypothetical protein